jgi:tetratricopeptide (TPR) repeat protein
MPSHIHLRLGDYRSASRCNERAIAVDEAYIGKHKIEGLYAMMYYPHNIHFLWFSAGMEGRCQDSIAAARKLYRLLEKADHHEMIVMIGWMRAVLPHGLVRFGKWDEVLAHPAPPCDSTLEIAMWHCARGVAFVRTGKQSEAEKELTALKTIAEDKELDKIELKDIPGASLVRLAHVCLTAEVAGSKGDAEGLVRGLKEAIGMEDRLPYMEPPFWYYPLRQTLGAALVQRGRHAEAEAVYRDDLKKRPHNGWSLFGLLQSLRAQGKNPEAAECEKRFQEAWKFADVTLTASRF